MTGERTELYEVFENLIDNAIKYGGDGGKVEIAVAPGRVGYDYAVTITDHGEGIEAQHVPRLTERFYRVDAESSRKKKGTGLGLAIVKHIVNRHRGQLTIRSKPGEGTRVEVLLHSSRDRLRHGIASIRTWLLVPKRSISINPSQKLRPN